MNSTNADTILDSTSDARDHLRGVAAEGMKEGKRHAGVLVDQAADLIDRVVARASETAGDVGRGVISYTKKNPLTALLLAVGAGALLIGATKSMQSRR